MTRLQISALAAFLAWPCLTAARAQTAPAPPASPALAPPALTDEEFDAWSKKYRDMAAKMLPDKWEMKVSRGSSAVDRGSDAGAYALNITFFRPDLVELPGPYGGMARIFLTISPKRFRQISGNPMPKWVINPWLPARRIHPANLIGATAEDHFYEQGMLSRHLWPTFAADIKKAFGIEPRFSTFDDLLFELRHGLHSDSLFVLIQGQTQAVKLRLARALVEELRTPAASCVIIDQALSRVTNQYVATPAANGALFHWNSATMTKEGYDQRNNEVAAVWAAWLRTAENQSEEQWMRAALDDKIAGLRPDATSDFKLSASAFFRDNIDGDFDPDDWPAYDQAYFDRITAWYRANKDRIAWDRVQQRFVLK